MCCSCFGLVSLHTEARVIFQVRCFIFQRADWSVGGHFTPVDLSSRTKAGWVCSTLPWWCTLVTSEPISYERTLNTCLKVKLQQESPKASGAHSCPVNVCFCCRVNLCFNQKPLRAVCPPSPLHHSGLILSSHPAGRFRLVSSQSFRTPPPHLSSGCKDPREGMKLKWGQSVKYRDLKTCNVLSRGRTARNCVFLLPFSCKHTNTSHGRRRAWMALPPQMVSKRGEQQLGVALRSIRGEMQRAKITALLTEKSCSPLCRIVLGWINLSTIDVKLYERRRNGEQRVKREETKRRKNGFDDKWSCAAGEKNTFLLQLFAEARSWAIKTARRDSPGTMRSFVSLLPMELRGVWYSSLVSIKHLMCQCVCTFTNSAEKASALLHASVSASSTGAAVQLWPWSQSD